MVMQFEENSKMPMWCLMSNECLACVGGCVGYEAKREKMQAARDAYSRAIAELPETKKMNEEFSRLWKTKTYLGRP